MILTLLTGLWLSGCGVAGSDLQGRVVRVGEMAEVQEGSFKAAAPKNLGEKVDSALPEINELGSETATAQLEAARVSRRQIATDTGRDATVAVQTDVQAAVGWEYVIEPVTERQLGVGEIEFRLVLKNQLPGHDLQALALEMETTPNLTYVPENSAETDGWEATKTGFRHYVPWLGRQQIVARALTRDFGRRLGAETLTYIQPTRAEMKAFLAEFQHFAPLMTEWHVVDESVYETTFRLRADPAKAREEACITVTQDLGYRRQEVLRPEHVWVPARVSLQALADSLGKIPANVVYEYQQWAELPERPDLTLEIDYEAAAAVAERFAVQTQKLSQTADQLLPVRGRGEARYCFGIGTGVASLQLTRTDDDVTAADLDVDSWLSVQEQVLTELTGWGRTLGGGALATA